MLSDHRMTISVTQLNEYLKSLISVDPLLRNLSLRGELSNFKRHSSGHLYFSLKDAQSVIRCVMFRPNTFSLHFSPKDGQQVVLSGFVSVYTRDGQMQFYCEEMQPEGEGALYLQFERNKARFQAEGLFDAKHKKKIPSVVKKIGVVTSPTGAVIRDIIRVTHRRNPSVDILLSACSVQGAGAAASIADAIEKLDALGDIDVIVVGRGGGSMEDLWAFNEEAVVRAVYASHKPIISAVGHETDYTLCDFAADLRASTPSNAAELAILEVGGAMQQIDELSHALRSATLSELKRRSVFLHSISERISARSAMRLLENEQNILTQWGKSFALNTHRAIERKEREFSVLSAKLRALDPESVLQRGYAVLFNQKGMIRSTHQVKENEEINIRLTDGRLTAMVTGIEREK